MRILSSAGGVWTLNVGIVIACAALLAGPVHDLPEFDLGVHITWWVLARSSWGFAAQSTDVAARIRSAPARSSWG